MLNYNILNIIDYEIVVLCTMYVTMLLGVRLYNYVKVGFSLILQNIEQFKSRLWMMLSYKSYLSIILKRWKINFTQLLSF